jgi:hypothetical protein
MRMYNDVSGIDDLANSFKDRIPENKLSGAEIQSFLIVSKHPQHACYGVSAWVEKTLSEKNIRKLE